MHNYLDLELSHAGSDTIVLLLTTHRLNSPEIPSYPWTVIRVDDREQYMQALETASVGDDPAAFARFIAEQIG